MLHARRRSCRGRSSRCGRGGDLHRPLPCPPARTLLHHRHHHRRAPPRARWSLWMSWGGAPPPGEAWQGRVGWAARLAASASRAPASSCHTATPNPCPRLPTHPRTRAGRAWGWPGPSASICAGRSAAPRCLPLTFTSWKPWCARVPTCACLYGLLLMLCCLSCPVPGRCPGCCRSRAATARRPEPPPIHPPHPPLYLTESRSASCRARA